MVIFGQSAGAFNTFAIATMNEHLVWLMLPYGIRGGGDFASVAEAQLWNDLFIAGLGC